MRRCKIASGLYLSRSSVQCCKQWSSQGRATGAYCDHFFDVRSLRTNENGGLLLSCSGPAHSLQIFADYAPGEQYLTASEIENAAWRRSSTARELQNLREMRR